jgi:hypothetical protein
VDFISSYFRRKAQLCNLKCGRSFLNSGSRGWSQDLPLPPGSLFTLRIWPIPLCDRHYASVASINEMKKVQMVSVSERVP